MASPTVPLPMMPSLSEITSHCHCVENVNVKTKKEEKMWGKTFNDEN